MPNKIRMTKTKDCVHSVPFATKNADAPISNVYVKRPLANHWIAVDQEWDNETGKITLTGVTI